MAPERARPGDSAQAVLSACAEGQPLPGLPAGAGVAQLLDANGQPLLTARVAGLKRWLAGQLGPPRPLAPGRRPPTDLRPVARAVRFLPTSGSFEQRLVYERWMAPLVPLARRRDLRPPAFLHLDLDQRFPRLAVRGEVAGAGLFFGPFRDRAAAEQAARPLLKRFPLRPCDFEFEPRPGLPLGESCFFAQVRSCSAPCLERIGASAYRQLARDAAALLSAPEPGGHELPRDCGEVRGRALVVERTKAGLHVFPVRDGAVLDGQALALDGEAALDAALEGLDWLAAGGVDDRAWLAAWLLEPRRRAAWLAWREAEEPASLAARARVVP